MTTDAFTKSLAAQMAGTARRTTIADGRYTITMTRHYGTSVADLWDACTNPERTRRWIGEARGELAVGGRIDLIMSPNPSENATVVIDQCAPPDVLTLRWVRPGRDDTEVRLFLHGASDDETTLTLQHIGFDPDLALAYGAGWEEFLVRLDAYIGEGREKTAEHPDLEAAATPLWDLVVRAAQ